MAGYCWAPQTWLLLAPHSSNYGQSSPRQQVPKPLSLDRHSQCIRSWGERVTHVDPRGPAPGQMAWGLSRGILTWLYGHNFWKHKTWGPLAWGICKYFALWINALGNCLLVSLPPSSPFLLELQVHHHGALWDLSLPTTEIYYWQLLVELWVKKCLGQQGVGIKVIPAQDKAEGPRNPVQVCCLLVTLLWCFCSHSHRSTVPIRAGSLWAGRVGAWSSQFLPVWCYSLLVHHVWWLGFRAKQACFSISWEIFRSTCRFSTL